MKLLLDTHIVLWSIMDNPKLTDFAKSLIQENSGESFFSAASVWEIAIKNSLPKRYLGISAANFIQEALAMGFRNMDVTTEHATVVESLPLIHGDPFDRMLVAQALVEGCTLVTHDDDIAKYGEFVRQI